MVAAIKQRWGVTVKTNQDIYLDSEGVRQSIPSDKQIGAQWDPGDKTIFLRKNATLYEIMHEVRHMVDDLGPNPPKTRFEAEDRVYDWIKQQNWLSKDDAISAYMYWHQEAVSAGVVPN